MAPGPFGLDPALWAILRLVLAVLLAVGLVFNGALAQIYLERKIQAIIQDRTGPLHTGPWGLLQTFADAIKLLGKEDIRAKLTDHWFFLAAPAIVFSPMLASYVVIPFAPGVLGADLNIGLLYLTTLGSMTVLGIVIAGWASNNKYSLIGGIRSAGQLISYEVPQILSLVTVVLVVGSLSMTKIVDSQEGWIINLLILPLAFTTYFIAGLAETNRVPFDLPEAESELVAGYMTEYTGVRFLLFFIAEFATAFAFSALAATMFLGGWYVPGIEGNAANWIGPLVLGGKIMLLGFLIFWIRFTYPRFREDQLQRIAWKVLIPVSLINIVATAVLKVAF